MVVYKCSEVSSTAGIQFIAYELYNYKKGNNEFVMEYKFSNRRRQRSKELITIVGERVAQRDHFCLIGNNGERGRRGASY